MQAIWTSIVKPALDAALPTPVVIQVGVDETELTPLLLGYCRDHGAVAHLVDAPAKGRQRGPRERYGSSVIRHRKPALRAIEDVDRIDVVLLDGRRDGEQLYRELSAIRDVAGREAAGFPLVLLHGELPPESGLAVERFLAETDLPLAFAAAEGEDGVGTIARLDAGRSHAQAPPPVRSVRRQRDPREPGPHAARIVELERAVIELERDRGGLRARLAGKDAEAARRARELERLAHDGTRIADDIVRARRARPDLPAPPGAPELAGDASPSTAIARLDAALRRVRVEVAELLAERSELDRRLRERGEELLAAARARSPAQAAAHAAQAGLGAAQAKSAREGERVRALGERLRAVEEREHELAEALADADRAVDAARAERDETEHHRAVAQDDLLRLQRRHEDLTWQIEEERGVLADQVRRVAQSRTWRYGHALDRLSPGRLGKSNH